MTQRPFFSSVITLGNLIQIIGMAAAIIIGYAVVEQRSKTNETALSDLRTIIKDVATRGEQQRTSLEARLRVLETSFARSDERYIAVMNLLRRIDDRLQRIEGQGRSR